MAEPALEVLGFGKAVALFEIGGTMDSHTAPMTTSMRQGGEVGDRSRTVQCAHANHKYGSEESNWR